jgi:hypothetical protein
LALAAACTEADSDVPDPADDPGERVGLASPSCGVEYRPGPGNTGPTNESILVPRSGFTVTQAGAVIENVRVTGTIRIQASNVTLRNFVIDAGGAPYGIQATYGASGLVIEDGEIVNASSAAIYGGGFAARRLEIHEMGSDAIKPTSDVLVEQSWYHHLGTRADSHADGAQSRWGGSNIIFRGNNCDIPVDVSGYRSNACFIVEPDGGPITNFVIEGNCLNGGNYTIYCSNQGVTVRNNRFGRAHRYGIRNACSNWSGNVWDDTGAPAE